MNEREHQQLQETLGAYALDAVDAVEARRIERHLQSCDDCANEVRALRETTAELAWLSEPADADDLVDRITSKLPARRARVLTRVAAGIAAVAVAAAGFLGTTLLRERGTNDRLEEVLATAQLQVKLGPQGGFDGHGVLYVAGDQAALVLDEVPNAGSGRVYQLWAIEGTTPRSMALAAGSGRVVRVFDWTGSADSFAVTIEPEGGSPVPTTEPVLAGSPA